MAVGKEQAAVPASQTWDDRLLDAQRGLIPWIQRTYPLAGRTVLEYGCGTGAVSCAFAPFVERHIGLDIDEAAIAVAREHVQERGVDNVELAAVPLERILDEFAAFEGQVDVVLLYAVLEHLTVAERLEVLELSRRVVRPSGVIVVCELPNRLIAMDSHTTLLPFFSQLPEDLMLRYWKYSERSDFTEAMSAAIADGPEAAQEALVRWGRGASFHEFELVFGDLRRHVLASSYDPVLLDVRPVTPDELALAATLAEHRPDLAPAWSRYWQDVILSPVPSPVRRRFIRPWTLETNHSPGVAWTRWGNLQMLSGAVLRIVLPAPSRRLVIGAVVQSDVLRYTLESGSGSVAVECGPMSPSGGVRYTTFWLPVAESVIELRLSDEGFVTFVGYESN